MRQIHVLVFIALCALPIRSHAQLAVYDAANELVNTITSIQTFITALQTVLLVADSVTNLTGGGTVSTGGAYGEDIAALQTLLAEAQGLSFDLQSLNMQINTLLSLDTSPNGLLALRMRRESLRSTASQAYLYALRVQTLMTTSIRIADRVLRIVEALSEVIGNLSGHQNASDQVAQLNQIQLTHNTTVQAFQRAETVSKAEAILVDESVQQINRKLLEDWPRR